MQAKQNFAMILRLFMLAHRLYLGWILYQSSGCGETAGAELVSRFGKCVDGSRVYYDMHGKASGNKESCGDLTTDFIGAVYCLARADKRPIFTGIIAQIFFILVTIIVTFSNFSELAKRILFSIMVIFCMNGTIFSPTQFIIGCVCIFMFGDMVIGLIFNEFESHDKKRRSFGRFK
jgi:hypothetical protein